MFQTRRARRSVLVGVVVAATAAAISIAGIGDASAATPTTGRPIPKVLGAGAKGAIADKIGRAHV